MKKRTKKLIVALVVLVAVAVGAVAIYAVDFYRADAVAAYALKTDEEIETVHINSKTVAFCPENPTSGIIFYPGGKVEYTAYAPLLEAIAQENILTVVIKMPLNLAVMNVNAADTIKENFPQIENWYMAGHSLGGSMAASYIADNADEFEGLIMLAAYSTADLTHTDIDVLSVYGSTDGVLDMEKYSDYYSNLPQDTTEFVIDGGCHAYFGSYGLQDGDGTASITPQEQIKITVEAVTDWIENR